VEAFVIEPSSPPHKDRLRHLAGQGSARAARPKMPNPAIDGPITDYNRAMPLVASRQGSVTGAT
jgi:hypothetical protein